MIDYVLVTVFYADKWHGDMELPAQIEIEKLREMLLEAMKMAEPHVFQGKTDIRIRYSGEIISEGSLFSNGIWDGSIIEIV